MKRIAVVAWAVLVVVGGGLTLLMDGAGPVGWDDWGRDEPAPTSCPSPEPVAEKTGAWPWPTATAPLPTAPSPTGSLPGLGQYEAEPMQVACAYRVED
jgi:hypothetical protein